MYFIPERILTKQIEQYIEHLPGFKPEELDVDSHAVLKSVEAQHGIFVERANRVHSFAHLTFQEYFTAKYIVDNAREGTLETLVNEHLYDDKWKEVFLLVAGMLDSAGEFLLLIIKKNQNLKNDVNVDKLTCLADQAIAKGDHYLWKALMRIIVMNMLLQPEKGEYVPFEELQKLLTDERYNWYSRLTEEEKKEFQQEIFEENELIQMTYEIGQALESYIQDISNAENVSGEITNASPELIKTLRSSFFLQGSLENIFSFFSAIELMVNILKSSSFVFKPIREKILNEMLMPGKEGE